jgi:hypothetical protein
MNVIISGATADCTTQPQFQYNLSSSDTVVYVLQPTVQVLYREPTATVGQGRAAARRPAWARGPVPGGAPLLARCGIRGMRAREATNARTHAVRPGRTHAQHCSLHAVSIEYCCCYAYHTLVAGQWGWGWGGQMWWRRWGDD